MRAQRYRQIARKRPLPADQTYCVARALFSLVKGIMRIAVWNLERPDPRQETINQARLAKIQEINADLWILTETHEIIDLSGSHHGASTSPSPRKQRQGEACAAIWSRWPFMRRIETSDPTEAVCVEIEHPTGMLLVYGSIIAYHANKGLDGAAPAWAEHYRFIDWHGQDWRKLRLDYPDHRLITAGDYNQNRDGAKWYGTKKGRDLLTGALKAASLSCVTEADLVAEGKLSTRHNVDHICMDTSLTVSVTAIGAWEGNAKDGLRLSDHNGVWVEVTDRRSSASD
jgi:hypothetical protein